MAGRVAWRSSASSWGITAAPAVAAATAPATTAAAGPRSSVARAPRAINFNTDVGSFSLVDRQNFRLKRRGLGGHVSGMLTECRQRYYGRDTQHGLHVYGRPEHTLI